MKRSKIYGRLVWLATAFFFVVSSFYAVAYAHICCCEAGVYPTQVVSNCCSSRSTHTKESEVCDCIGCIEHHSDEKQFSIALNRQELKSFVPFAIIQRPSLFEYFQNPKPSQYKQSLFVNQTPLHIICSTVLLI